MQDYTDGEIVGIYRDGMDDPEIIYKLTQLTLLPKKKILAILRRNGYDPTEAPAAEKNEYTDQQWWKVVQLQIMDRAYQETSEATGIPAEVIRAEWRDHAVRLGVLLNRAGDRIPPRQAYTLEPKRKRKARKYTDDAWQLAIELRVQGVSVDEIAAMSGIPAATFSSNWRPTANRLGITVPTREEMARRDRQKRSRYTEEQWRDAVGRMLAGDAVEAVSPATGIKMDTLRREWFHKAEAMGIQDAYDRRQEAMRQRRAAMRPPKADTARRETDADRQKAGRRPATTDDQWREAIEMKLSGVRLRDISWATGISVNKIISGWKKKAIQLGLIEEGPAEKRKKE